MQLELLSIYPRLDPLNLLLLWDLHSRLTLDVDLNDESVQLVLEHLSIRVLKSLKLGRKPDPKGMILCSLLVELCITLHRC